MPKTIKTKFDPRNDFSTVGTPTNEYTSAGTVTATYNKSLNLIGWWKFDAGLNPNTFPTTVIAPDTVDQTGRGNSVKYETANRSPYLSSNPPSKSHWIQDYSLSFSNNVNGPGGSNDYGYVENPSNNLFSFGRQTPTPTDLPFSISFWIYPVNNTANVDSHIIRKADIDSAKYEWQIYSYNYDADEYAKIFFTLWNNNDPTTWVYVTTTAEITPYRLNKWTHVTITYDGRGGASASNGMKIYMDGVSQALSQNSSGDYIAMAATNCSMKIAAKIEDDDPESEFRGDLASLCIWNAELSAADAQALYESKNGSYKMMTGYLNNPPKTIIAEWDNMTGSYPTTLRTTGRQSTSGRGIDPFDDTRTIIYGPSNTIVYPFVLNNADKRKYESNWVASPNGALDQMEAPATASSGVSDQRLKPSVNQHLLFEPFDESRIYLADTSFYLTGTNPSVYPGFGSRLADKIQIKIPLNSDASKIVSRWSFYGTSKEVQRHSAASITNAEVFNDGHGYHSGFLYYNAEKKGWEDIGLWDPQTGNSLHQSSWYIESRDADYVYACGNWIPPDRTNYQSQGGGAEQIDWTADPLMPFHYKAYQFSMSSHIGFIASSVTPVSGGQSLTGMGYSKIGSPTISGMAPFSNMYYATSSQRIQMSDYISHPFVLEKAVIDIPVTVQMMWDNTDDEESTSLCEGASRDIDNYTFFIYRQSTAGGSGARFMGSGSGDNNVHYGRGAVIDSPTEISASRRFLIASGCASFYNANAFNSTIQADLLSDGLLHKPSFEHRFTPRVSGSQAEFAHSVFTGSIRIEMIPAVGNRQFNAGSRFVTKPLGTGGVGSATPPHTASSAYQGSVVIQDFWPGGTSPVITSLPFQTQMLDATSTVQGPFRTAIDKSAGFLVPGYSGADHKNMSRKFRNLGFFKNIPPNNTYAEQQSNTTSLSVQRFKLNAIAEWDPPGSQWGIELDHFLDTAVGVDPRPLRAPTGLATNTESAPYLYSMRSGMTKNQFAAMDPPGWSTAVQVTMDNDRGSQITHGDLPSAIESPYILLPGDEIIIGLDAGTSSTIVSSSLEDLQDGPCRTIPGSTRRTKAVHQFQSSYMKILQGEASITFFGSMVKEKKERLFELNQPLTSDAIHEAIGNEPIVDQFRAYSRHDLSGSYTSRIIIGRVKPFKEGARVFDNSAMINRDPSAPWDTYTGITLPQMWYSWSVVAWMLAYYGVEGEASSGTPGTGGYLCTYRNNNPLEMPKFRRLMRGAYGDFSRGTKGIVLLDDVGFPIGSDRTLSEWKNIQGIWTRTRNKISDFYFKDLLGLKRFYLSDSVNPADLLVGGGMSTWNAVDPPLQTDKEGLMSYNVKISNSNATAPLQGMIQIIDRHERFYDTLMPEIVDYVNRSMNGTRDFTAHFGTITTDETIDDMSDESLYDDHGDLWSMHIKSLPGTNIPIIRARLNGWTGCQLVEQSSLGPYRSYNPFQYDNGNYTIVTKGCANKYAFPYATSVARVPRQRFLIQVKPSAWFMDAENDRTAIEDLTNLWGANMATVGADQPSYPTDLATWSQQTPTYADGTFLFGMAIPQAVSVHDDDISSFSPDVSDSTSEVYDKYIHEWPWADSSNSAPIYRISKVAKWVTILDSDDESVAAKSVLFKKGYDLGFLASSPDRNVTNVFGRLRLKYHPVTNVLRYGDGSREGLTEVSDEVNPQAGVPSYGSMSGSISRSYDNHTYLSNQDGSAVPSAGAQFPYKSSGNLWGSRNNPTSFSGSPQNIGAKAYGFAYGIQNVRRQTTKMIFRSDRFGQFRDMLEQRQYGKFFMTRGRSKNANKPYSRGSSRRRRGNEITDGPIQCVFVDGADGQTVVNPYLTDSRNMSFESTSSIPFIEGKFVTGSGVVTLSVGEDSSGGVYGIFFDKTESATLGTQPEGGLSGLSAQKMG